MKEKEIHEKAIRLVEGGIVDIDGLCVAMRNEPNVCDPCFVCELDCICHKGNNLCNVCEECDSITNGNCFLVIMENIPKPVNSADSNTDRTNQGSRYEK